MFNPWNEIDNGYEELCIKIAIFFPIYPLFTYVRTSMSQQQQEHSISWHSEKHRTFHTVQNTNKMGRDLYIHRAFLIVN